MLERRQALARRGGRARPGVMLDRPSLLAQPRAVSDAAWEERNARDGQGFAGAPPACGERGADILSPFFFLLLFYHGEGEEEETFGTFCCPSL